MPKDQNYVRGILRNQLRNENREQIDWTFYDSILLSIASANQNLTFFQNTIGSVGIARTNMHSAGALPSPQTFAVTSIRIFIINADGASFLYAGGAAPAVSPLNYIFNTMTWNFKVDPSVEYEGHGFQFWQQVDYLNDSGALLAVSGYPVMPWKTVKFKCPIPLIATRAFSVNVNLTTPAAGGGYSITTSKIYCEINGLLRRNP